MAKRDDIESTNSDAAASPPAAAEAKSELPAVDSPSISPGSETPAIEPIAMVEPASAPEIKADDATPAASRFAFKLSDRYKRHALLAASVALAVAIGAGIGAVATGGLAPPAPKASAALHEREAMQKSIARLSKEVTTLKANLAAANKAAHSQIAKITDKITDRLNDKLNERPEPAKAPETTGSIPTPPPRPNAAAVESQPPVRAPVIKDWAIRDARGGFVYVQGHGEIYQVVPGAPLPGLGPVQAISRQGGHLVVVMPKGLIVSMRDRPFFE
jgi:hypothetical protein